MKRTLIIHHLEPCWNPGYDKFGTNFHEQELKAARWIRKNKPEHVILTRFEDITCSFSEYEYLPNLVNQVEPYAYGWDKEDAKQLKKLKETVVPGGNHSEFVWVPKWIKQLKGQNVRVFGAFKYECLEDIEIALKAAKVQHQFVNQMCVG